MRPLGCGPTHSIRVTRRAGGRLVGQLTVFSSLNVESARLAHHGNPDAAARVAHAEALTAVARRSEQLRAGELVSFLPW
ncbi:MAG: hypothetical protein ACT4NY_06030 [Pseudonocardiales bacterium]